jgi:hypothetical protein
MIVGYCKETNRLLMEEAPKVDKSKKKNRDGMMIKKKIMRTKHSKNHRKPMKN